MGEPGLGFGAFVLWPGARRLERDGEAVPLGARAFDLLCALARRGGRVAGKDELLGEVWAGLVVSDANLHVQVSQLRRALGAGAIENLPGRGYRLVPPVHPLDGAAPTRRLSVIVLPFVEPGAPDGQGYVADALTDDVTAELSHIRGSFVIGTPTAMVFKHTAFDLAAHARELGVRYALQGRIERDGARLEVHARLSDAATGGVIWSETIAVPQADPRAMRSETVARLAAALDLELVRAEAARVDTRRDPAAVDLLMQGRAAGGRNWTRASYLRSRGLFDAALAREPELAEALAHRAHVNAVLATAWPGPEIEAQIAQAEADAQQALRIDPQEPVAWLALGMARLMQYRVADAAQAADRGLEFAPNAPALHDLRAEVHRHAGDAALGFAPARRALALSPRDPHRWVFELRQGWLHLHLGEYVPALHRLEASHALHPHWTTTTALIALHGHLGTPERARALAPLLDDPEVEGFRRWHRASREPRFLDQLRTHLYAGLMKAGYRSDTAAWDDWLARQRRGGGP